MPVYLLAWTAGLVIVFNTSFGKTDWFVWLLSVGTLVVMHYGIKAEERTKRDARIAGSAKYESIIAVSEFSGDRLVEVRLYPVELRYDSERLAHRGIPETASPETGRRILERLRDLSAPLGTTIAIEGGVGVIRR